MGFSLAGMSILGEMVSVVAGDGRGGALPPFDLVHPLEFALYHNLVIFRCQRNLSLAETTKK